MCIRDRNYTERVELSVDVARAGAVTAAQRNVLLRWRTLRQHAQEHGSRRRRELTRSRRPVSDVESLEQTDRSRSRHWKDAVRGFHRAVTERDLRVVNALDPQQLDAPDRPDDVENRIDGSDLVQMQLVGRDTVNRALYRSNRLERLVGGPRAFFRNLHRIDQPMDLGDRSPMRLRRNLEVHFDAVNVRALYVGDANLDSRQSQRVWQSLEPRSVSYTHLRAHETRH